MPFIYVTGASGTGKTTVCHALKQRGFEAHDTDKDGLAFWVRKSDSNRAQRPDRVSERTHDWYSGHAWVANVDRVKKMAKDSENRTVFLCGGVSNNDEIWHLFDKVFCLSLDSDSLKARLANRTNNDWGKAPDELAEVLSWHKEVDGEHQKRGAVLVDASKSLDAVVEEILLKTNGG